MLDVEKWWSVVLVHFSGLDSANAWSVEVALDKIGQALAPPVLINEKPQALPRRVNLPVQEIIDRFDYLRQRLLLQDVIRQLQVLRVFTPPSVVSLLDDYRHALENYLDQRDRAGVGRSLAGLPTLNADRLVHATVEKLNNLDRRRAELAATATSTAAAGP
jgi:hypothetical protein